MTTAHKNLRYATMYSLSLLISCIGCNGTTAPEASATNAASVEHLGPATTEPNTSVTVPPASRAVRRLRVQQLREVISTVAGTDVNGDPIQWTIKIGNTELDALSDQVLAPTLGHPDYISITTEAAEVTPLYAKFADDMARDVCRQIVAADAKRPNADTRVLTRFVEGNPDDSAAAIAANLRYLQLRFIGEFVADTDTETIAPLQEVYDTVAPELGAIEAWRAVCVTLLTSPQFHVY